MPVYTLVMMKNLIGLLLEKNKEKEQKKKGIKDELADKSATFFRSSDTDFDDQLHTFSFGIATRASMK